MRLKWRKGPWRGRWAWIADGPDESWYVVVRDHTKLWLATFHDREGLPLRLGNSTFAGAKRLCQAHASLLEVMQ